ncbi:MAG: hypothetical protein LUE27_11630 [Clostridia bacterium]|nr:hypothetical protein [Clostridia bacterium]
MIKEAVIFHEKEDLMELTGLTRKGILDDGFNLDDFDGGIRVNEPPDTNLDGR